MNRRILLAMALTFLAWNVYLRFLAPKPPPTSGPFETPRTDVPPAPVAPPGEPTAAEAPPSPPQAPPSRDSVQDTEERSVIVTTPLYRAVLTNRGGVLKSFTLTRFKDRAGKPLELTSEAEAEALGIHPLSVTIEDRVQNDRLQKALHRVSAQSLDVKGGGSAELELRWSDGRDLSTKRTFRFSGDSYRFDTTVSVISGGVEIPKKIFLGPGLGPESLSGRYVQPDKGVVRAASALQVLAAGDIGESTGASVDVQVAGIAGHYFAALLIAPPGGGYAASLRKATLDVPDEGGKLKKKDLITASLEVPRGVGSVGAFLGPKDEATLSALAPGLRLEALVDYGWFKFLAVPLHRALVWLYRYVGNYGWAIVLLTLAINVLLSPLKHFSYVSMKKMQALAPQVKRIQERYKKLKPTDPRRQEMNQEVLALYREHKVSPFSGCLPMLLMIPFFIAFYSLLSVAIELRQAAFIAWVKDLSSPDPYWVLPILMGVSQIVIQKMTPQTSADPVQAKLMMIMPAVFVVFLLNAPSGLVLYWFVNNLVSLGQQLVTNRLVGPTG